MPWRVGPDCLVVDTGDEPGRRDMVDVWAGTRTAAIIGWRTLATTVQDFHKQSQRTLPGWRG